MPSKLNLLSAVMLAALLRSASGAPVEDATRDSPAGDPSGEEEEPPADLLSASPLWDMVYGEVERLQNVFEFPAEVKYMGEDKIPLPEKCPESNFNKEVCLQRLVQGLFKYTVLLKHVEKEYPSSSIPTEAKQIRMSLGLLISLIKDKMTDSEQVTALTSSQEEQLLRDVDDTDTFHRKMTALRILSKLRDFIADGKRAVKKMERPRRSMAERSIWYPSVITKN